MSRTLETVLTARNLLSPELLKASRDVVAFNSTVMAANEKAAASSAASARSQQAAANSSAAASGKAATASTTGAVTQSAAADKIAASNVKASTSASVSADQQVRAYTRTAESATASSSVQSRAHARAAESATVSARVQETANRSLITSNGLLGTSLTPLTAGLGAVALGLAYAGYRGMDFDSAMSQVQAASQASAADMGKLRDAAVDAGAKTQYSAVEAAQGITEMSKAGVSAKDILGGGLTGALNLAAAGQISVAEAAETGATALSVFNLKGDQMSHVADLLAAGAGKAQGSVGDLSAALNQSALVASQTGLSIEDTAGALAMFASNGLIGSDAGTSFKTMLQALTPNSVAAATAMDAIGFSAYDSQGKFIGLEAVAGQLRTGLAGLTEEQRNTTLETIFGSDAVRAASVLYKEGSAGVDEWAGKVNDAGFAARQAADLNDNLRGDLERLGGAFDSTMTTMGEGAQGPLREAVQMLTHLVDIGGDVLGFWNSLPGPVQVAILTLGGVAALKGPVSSTFETIALKALYMRDSVAGASIGMGGLKTAGAGLLGVFGGPWGLAIAGAVTGLSLLTSWLGDSGDATDDVVVSQTNLAQALRETKGAIDETVRAAAAKDLEGAGLLRWAEKLGVESSVLTDALLGVPGAVDEVTGAFDRYSQQNSRVIVAGRTTSTVLTGQGQAAKDAKGSFLDLAGIQGDTAASQERVTAATAETGAAIQATTAQTEAAIEANEKWLESLQGIAEGFVDPLAAYQALLSQKQDAERASAEVTAASTANSKDSWKDYVTDVDVSLDELADRLAEQIENQENWRTNIGRIAAWAGTDVAQHLADMGEEGVDLVAKMADGSSAEAQRMAGLIRDDIRLGGMEWTGAMDAEMKNLQAIATAGGKRSAAGLAYELGIGVDQVAAIAARYGIVLADGINPLLGALGQRTVALQKRGEGMRNADGNLYEEHQAEIAPGGAWRIWAEPETGGESYIPHSAAKRPRALDIWRKTGKILNAPEAQYYAAGGFTTAADVPRPPSTAPYRAPISTAGDAAMGKEYDETRAWLTSTMGAMGGGPAGAGVQRWLPLVLASLNLVGQPGGLAQTVLRRMQQESGGNPRAINLWDSNAKRGTPSKGLMQVIDPTFRAYAMPGHNTDIWDPLSNILASERYAMARYGSLSAAYNKAGGYDSGGLATTAGLLAKPTVAPERVLSPRQTEAFERWMATAPAAMPGYGMGGAGGGGRAQLPAPHVTVLARVFVGTREITDIARVEATTVVDNAFQEAHDQQLYNR